MVMVMVSGIVEATLNNLNVCSHCKRNFNCDGCSHNLFTDYSRHTFNLRVDDIGFRIF